MTTLGLEEEYLLLDPASSNATISAENRSPVTPAGYAFSIWGLIYLASLALAYYQARADQRGRELHRRTGWWLVAAFLASTVWVPVFSTRTIWLVALRNPEASPAASSPEKRSSPRTSWSFART